MKTGLLTAILLASGILIHPCLRAEDDYSDLGVAIDEAQSSPSDIGSDNFDSGLLPGFHRRNLPVKPDETLLARSCEELDYAISYLLPSTYSYKPDFFEDNYHGAAIWGSTISEFSLWGSSSQTVTFMENAWLYLPYSWLVGYLEQGKQHKAFYHVEKIRRAKAMKNCYVN